MASVSHRGGKPNFQEAEVIRNQSAFFRAECKRLISETSKRCRDMQNDQSQKLGKRRWGVTGQQLQEREAMFLFALLSRPTSQRGPVYEDRVGAEVGGDCCGNG